MINYGHGDGESSTKRIFRGPGAGEFFAVFYWRPATSFNHTGSAFEIKSNNKWAANNTYKAKIIKGKSVSCEKSLFSTEAATGEK
jgi:hypothetical protein